MSGGNLRHRLFRAFAESPDNRAVPFTNASASIPLYVFETLDRLDLSRRELPDPNRWMLSKPFCAV